MQKLPRSSGDLLADRRADYAEMLFANGEHAAAAELMLGAMELTPEWALGWFRLGEFQEAAGAKAEAAQAWRLYLSLDPADRAGAALKLAVIGEVEAPEAPPSEFVEALFDEYAANFDVSLVEKLGYRVPNILSAAIDREAPDRRFRLALDLGCGTGLMGVRLRRITDTLVGYDISAEMLKKAASKHVYDRLEKVDLQHLGQESISAELVTAADVFMYIGALDGVFSSITQIIQPDGLFAFSVEDLEGKGFALRDTRRYAHSESYVRDQLAAHGLEVRSVHREPIRMDRNAPIAGLIIVASPAD